MCGIIGTIGNQPAKSILLGALTQLEYRGYDSAGIALITDQGVEITRAVGKVEALEAAAQDARDGLIGIGHTRWATHGGVTVPNAHPHRAGRVTLVHNGIIENFAVLRERLARSGRTPVSETDTEIAAMLIDSLYDGDPAAAILEAAKMIEGAFALVVLFDDVPDRLFAIRRLSPLVALTNAEGSFIASDMTALLEHGRDYFTPPEGALMIAYADGIDMMDGDGQPLEPEMLRAEWDHAAVQKAGYPHYMLKEIFEQPDALRRTILPRISAGAVDLSGDALPDQSLHEAERFYIVGCGTAMHAGLWGKQFMERLLRVPVEVDIASEFRYRSPILSGKTPVIAISQSGETADTLAALRLARSKGAPTIAIVNVKGSTIARESDAAFYTHAGPEIAVASTKAFTVQLSAVYLIAMHIAKLRGLAGDRVLKEMTRELKAAPELIEQALAREEAVSHVAGIIHRAPSLFYTGRGADLPLAMEGSLKLKEICYVHSEAYGAGELKHGAISLIEPGVPVIALMTQRAVYKKALSGMREVHARGAVVVPVTVDGWNVEESGAAHVLRIPGKGDHLSAFPLAATLQLLAYHCAAARGLSIDQPRNLAKSVTVE